MAVPEAGSLQAQEESPYMIWQERHGYLPSPRNREGALIYPVYTYPPIPLGVPELDWTVQVRGWKLVILDGTIRGLEET